MRSRIVAGAVAGLVAAIAAAAVLSIEAIPSPAGKTMRIISLMAQSVRSDSTMVAWLALLVAGMVIGALFGGVFATRAVDLGSASALAVIYGLVWWVVGWLVLMPLARGMPALAAVTMPSPSRLQIVMAGLLAHLAFGAVLGGMFAWLVDNPALGERRGSLHRAA
jgi:hypothetical protein